ncbi:MAG: Uncharacterised protein [Hyphomonas sp. TMED17]|nr:MAG: Uncharacterised protein [Hyphomonas sp. TMED17]
MVAVIASMRRQIEGHRETFLASSEIAAVKGVGVLCRGEAGILSDRPGSLGVHCRVGTTSERRQTRIIIEVIESVCIGRGISCCKGNALRCFQRSPACLWHLGGSGVGRLIVD